MTYSWYTELFIVKLHLKCRSKAHIGVIIPTFASFFINTLNISKSG